jgi:hypothetical protein
MSTDGGFNWSAPIKVNQTPTNIPSPNQQAFMPSISVNDEGVVAVTYYDFRNNTPAPGLPTDYWMVHAHPSDGLTNPASWSAENRLTTTSFNMEDAPPTPDGYYLGFYQGMVAMGGSFGAFFSMPHGTDSASVFFRAAFTAEPRPGNEMSHSETRPKTTGDFLLHGVDLRDVDFRISFAIPDDSPHDHRKSTAMISRTGYGVDEHFRSKCVNSFGNIDVTGQIGGGPIDFDLPSSDFDNGDLLTGQSEFLGRILQP